MIIYVVLWIMILAPYLLTNKHMWKNFHRNYAIYIFLCLLVLLGFRHISVGTDTKQYEYLYSISSEHLAIVKHDRGYYVFSNFFNQLGLSFQFYNFIVAFILVGSLVIFYATYSKNISFSALIFMTIGLLPMYMSGTRQSLAISICLMAYVWADKHRGLIHTILACLVVWLASTFHSSAVVCYVAIAVITLRLRLSRQGLIALVLIAAAAMVYRNQLANLLFYILPEKYLNYDLNADYRINPLLIIIAIMIPAFCLIFDVDTERDGKYSPERTWMYLFSCANILFTILAKNSMYFSRIAYYFVHVNSLLIPNMISTQRLRTNAYVMYIVIGVICMLYFLISIPGGALGIDNYMFFWQR